MTAAVTQFFELTKESSFSFVTETYNWDSNSFLITKKIISTLKISVTLAASSLSLLNKYSQKELKSR